MFANTLRPIHPAVRISPTMFISLQLAYPATAIIFTTGDAVTTRVTRARLLLEWHGCWSRARCNTRSFSPRHSRTHFHTHTARSVCMYVCMYVFVLCVCIYLCQYSMHTVRWLHGEGKRARRGVGRRGGEAQSEIASDRRNHKRIRLRY